MSSLFDKLGDMLNECLEKGEIPQPQPKRTYYQKAVFTDADSNQQDIPEPEKATQKIITLPREVEEALSLLGFSLANNQQQELPIPSLGEVRGVYAQFLKEAHPDTATEETSSTQAAQRIAQLTSAFTTVRDFYKKLGLEGSK